MGCFTGKKCRLKFKTIYVCLYGFTTTDCKTLLLVYEVVWFTDGGYNWLTQYILPAVAV